MRELTEEEMGVMAGGWDNHHNPTKPESDGMNPCGRLKGLVRLACDAAVSSGIVGFGEEVLEEIRETFDRPPPKDNSTSPTCPDGGRGTVSAGHVTCDPANPGNIHPGVGGWMPGFN